VAEPGGADARIEELRTAYRGRSRRRLEEAEGLAAGLGSSPESLDALRRIAHEFHGSGGSFGFPAVSEAGAALEAACEALAEGSPGAGDQVAAALSRLRAAIS
jgi:HPt (histidine-containing phosphotransfer) domain-containing protein